MSGIEKSASLTSGNAAHWSHGTKVELSWSYEPSESAGDAYRARDVRVVVHPAEGVQLASVEIHLLERFPQTGMVASDIRRQLTLVGERYETSFDWNSTTSIPEQELHVALKTYSLDEPEVRLQDPLSRRFNFLVSFAG